jgi:hypothetical protein
MSEGISNISIDTWEVSRLIPYELNNKKHPADHVTKLAESIAKFGFENPILVEEDGTIISGHGRRMAAIQLGLKFVPVRVAVGLSKDRARQLRIAANKTSSNEYDVDALSFELKDFRDLDMDLDGLGINDKEILVMVDDVGEMDLSSLTTDIRAAVEAHDEDTSEASDRMEGSELPIAKAFGIKKIPVSSVRVVTRFLGTIEAKTGKSGLEALIAHMEDVVAHG